LIINYELSHDKAIERVMKRAKMEGRIDDIWESIKVRFDVFEDETLPTIKYFQEKGKVITINANDTIENVLNNTVKSLKENNYI
jgi:adenylate kinase family enzyme